MPPRPSPVHRRQYVIAPDRHPIAPDWRHEELGGGLWLSACPRLRLRRLEAGDGSPLWLLGEAYPCEPGAADLALPATARLVDMVRATYGWSGRWVLVGGGHLLTDPANLANVQFAATPGGGLAALSGSPALLRQACPWLKPHGRHIGWYGFNWFPTPGSRLDGADKLLPDQALDLAAGRAVRIRRGAPDAFAGLDGGALGRRLLDHLATVLRHAAAGRRLTIALTGGQDSRTMLAAALHARLDVATFIQAHPHIPRADLEVPRTITRTLAIPHRTVPWGRMQAARRREFLAHGLLSHADIDLEFYGRGMFDGFDADEVIVRGGIFELGRGFWDERFAGLSWEAALADPALLAARFPDFGSQPFLARQLARWVEWAAADPDPRMSLGDRFYRDQRLAGWLASSEQAADLLECGMLQACNSALLHDLLLAAGPADRAAGALQREAIRAAGHGLDRFPVNPALCPETAKRRARRADRLRRLRGELWNLWADGSLPVARKAATTAAVLGGSKVRRLVGDLAVDRPVPAASRT